MWWSVIGIFFMFGLVYAALAYAVSKGDDDEIERYGGMTDAEVDALINGSGDDDPMGR